MAFIIGVVCDGCGGSDIDSAEKSDSDKINLPRKGWVSIAIWQGDVYGTVDHPELHACSTKCMKTVAEKLDVVAHKNDLTEDIDS